MAGDGPFLQCVSAVCAIAFFSIRPSLPQRTHSRWVDVPPQALLSSMADLLGFIHSIVVGQVQEGVPGHPLVVAGLAALTAFASWVPVDAVLGMDGGPPFPQLLFHLLSAPDVRFPAATAILGLLSRKGGTSSPDDKRGFADFVSLFSFGG